MPGWFHGFYKGDEDVPLNNNGLEGKNDVIKSMFTLRYQLTINEFMECMCKMLTNWSMDEESDFGQWHDDIDPNLIDSSLEMAFHFGLSEPTIEPLSNRDPNVFLVYKNENKNKVDRNIFKYDFKSKKYKDMDFDAMYQAFKIVKRVDLNRECWSKSKCSCTWFLKNYHCYHIMAVAVRERLLQIPLRCMTAEIAAKAKRGRKRRAVGGEALVNPEEANKQKGRAAKKSRKSTSEVKTKQTKKQMLNKLSKK